MSYKFKYGNKEIEVPKNSEFTSHAHSWGAITGKPSTFTPSSHNQDWGTITGKPSTFSPSNHNHNYATWLGKQYASGAEWLGFYNAYGGTRKGWIGHDGSTSFQITNETGGNIQLNNFVYLTNGMSFPNVSGLYGRETSGTDRVMVTMGDDNAIYLGNWGSVNNTVIRGKTVKLNSTSGATVTSDKNLKKDINIVSHQYEKFFMSLKPSTYIYDLKNHKRVHSGFIAQEVEQALKNNGLSTSQFAGI